MTAFDHVAADFDRFRALPAGVPPLIREAFWTALGAVPDARLLDLGAGTGRIGAEFVAAGDPYVAVDPSRGMLGQFAEKFSGRGGPAPGLVQADGRALPFAEATFDAVLLVQVVSGVAGWRRMLAEARRVLRPGGALVLGKSVGPPDGLDARMRDRLDALMAAGGVDGRRRGAGRDEVNAALADEARRHVRVVAARWESLRRPRDFLARHRTGARFSALPPATRDDLLGRLAGWAAASFGSLDAESAEPYSFELDLFTY